MPTIDLIHNGVLQASKVTIEGPEPTYVPTATADIHLGWHSVNYNNGSGLVKSGDVYTGKPLPPGTYNIRFIGNGGFPKHEVEVTYRQVLPTPTIIEHGYIPATTEGSIAGDHPATFGPLLLADGQKWARCWTNLLVTYGDIDEWNAAGMKVLATCSFRENTAKLSESCSIELYREKLDITADRLKNAGIVNFGNEWQFRHYVPTEIPQTTAGFKTLFDGYYKPLADRIGRERMCGPSLLPHYEGAKYLKMMVDAGFFDPSITAYADYHLYFAAGTSKQQIVDAVGACDALLPKGIKRVSSEYGKDINDKNLDYSRLESVYATYGTLGITPMCHFMGGTMNRFADHTKGIYSRSGKRINADVRACLAKSGAKVQAVQSIS